MTAKSTFLGDSESIAFCRSALFRCQCIGYYSHETTEFRTSVICREFHICTQCVPQVRHRGCRRCPWLHRKRHRHLLQFLPRSPRHPLCRVSQIHGCDAMAWSLRSVPTASFLTSYSRDPPGSQALQRRTFLMPVFLLVRFTDINSEIPLTLVVMYH